ncbi:terpenoid synthase [Lindgomyces ingoldianus]|uniref:Terpenoid synthase n=1 Tax=Lindgomyces ingoldianus TaxID=673940 RepID=A0ACB6Q9F1_9PLEO|nr:terpenoid synthase [Lindgomyces ingoldianus]KAF2462742.1 terpenoid synthase [Lindgomyces ingoldianus]
MRSFDCPYDYLLSIYGPHHFKKIIANLSPNLEHDDPHLYLLVLEVMDAIHFGAILVDDVADDSMLRKGHKSAHRIYGASETINRAYLIILNVVMKCQRERPELVPFILDCVTGIHQGQDDSLVWRRDGFPFPAEAETALQMYRRCASMKTGALFKLVGQLITGSHDQDDLMNEYGHVAPAIFGDQESNGFHRWYCQLQNDCKNVFSSDVVTAKGALAEDLINGEYSYPIILGLYSSQPIKSALENAFNRKRGNQAEYKAAVNRAVCALQGEEVRSLCLEELRLVRQRNLQFATLWGREEKMEISSLST